MYLQERRINKDIMSKFVFGIILVLSIFSRGMLLYTVYFLILSFYSAFKDRNKFLATAAFLFAIDLAGSLFNADWNNSQSEWNRYVVPYLNEKYFLAEQEHFSFL